MKKILLFITIIVFLVCVRCDITTEASAIDSEPIVKKHTLQDGVTIAVHYQLKDIKPYQNNPGEYADMVLEFAVKAYSKIVYGQGFNTPGFAFANADKDYCYDQDKTIDIYIAEGGKGKKGLHSFSGTDFLDAPCYDIAKGKGKDYDAVILFPADYKGHLDKWNVRVLSEQKIANMVKGTLFHEMFHLITYSYNKNIESWYSRRNGTSLSQGGDWYVEGLARYFETLACSYDNFFSRGFVKREANKRILSQEGANYLMENPSEPLKKARYDYSLFWAYIHKRYGMEKIEEISRRFRFITKEGMEKEMPAIISAVLKGNFEDILQGFALAMYFKDFNPDIKKGLVDLKVMSLDDFSREGEKKVASWASNFITLDLNDEFVPAVIGLKKTEDRGELKINIFARFQDGRIAPVRRFLLDRTDLICQMDLSDIKQCGVKELIVIITNASPDCAVAYKFLQS